MVPVDLVRYCHGLTSQQWSTMQLGQVYFSLMIICGQREYYNLDDKFLKGFHQDEAETQII